MFAASLIVALLLLSSSLASTSNSVGIQSSGTIAYAPALNINLGVIPNDWVIYDNVPSSWTACSHLDYSVTHNGDVSIRIDPHTSSDTDTTRESDGTYYSCKPGDNIVITVWVKTTASGLHPDPSQYAGGSVGIDYYGHTTAGYGILCATSSASSELGVPGWFGNAPGAIGSWWVSWGSDWTMIGWNVTVPSTWCSYVSMGGTHLACNSVQVDSFVAWLGVGSPNNPGLAWFADAVLYINPT